jgi:hypothetical protein
MEMLDEVILDIRAINNRLSEGMIFLPSFDGLNDSEYFFKNINFFKFNANDIVVLSLTPDGDDTVIGRFMTKEKDVYFFDFDLEDCKYSRLIKIEPREDLDESSSFRNSEFLEELAGGGIFLDERG